MTRLLTHNSADQLMTISDGTGYSYDARGLRVKQNRNGAIYTLYGPDERLMFRFDDQTKVTSEYFYADGKLVARRDADISDPTDTELSNDTPDDTDTPNNADDESGINVNGLTISWPDDGWYQVQTEDSSKTICEGGRSCTVPSNGIYKVINHSTDTKSKITVGADSEGGSTGGSTQNGINVNGLTISWPDDGWYQVQTDGGGTTICEGGQSCTVPSSGTYKIINHSTGVKTHVEAK